MFRSAEAPNPLQKLVDKATDQSLTSDNWQYILDVCDEVAKDPEDGCKNAIAAVEKRLQSTDANVLLRTLSLITALAENCGSRMKQEIATKKFGSILVKLATDKKVHVRIKEKLLEMMQQLVESFKSDPSLKPLEDAYNQITRKVHVNAPAKPEKQKMTYEDKLKEEEDLKQAIMLSLREMKIEESPKPTAAPSGDSNPTEEQNVPVSESRDSATTVHRVRALYDLTSYEEDELSFKAGDIITVLEGAYRDWWKGSLRGKVGIFPLNYVTPLKDPTPEEIMREQQEEAEVMRESRNIERLLSILSSINLRSNSVDQYGNPDASLLNLSNNPEIQQCYDSVAPLKPKLGRLIEKYSQKKEDLILLNKMLIESELLYNQLMEQSISRYTGGYPNNQYQAVAPPSAAQGYAGYNPSFQSPEQNPRYSLYPSDAQPQPPAQSETQQQSPYAPQSPLATGGRQYPVPPTLSSHSSAAGFPPTQAEQPYSPQSYNSVPATSQPSQPSGYHQQQQPQHAYIQSQQQPTYPQTQQQSYSQPPQQQTYQSPQQQYSTPQTPYPYPAQK